MSISAQSIYNLAIKLPHAFSHIQKFEIIGWSTHQSVKHKSLCLLIKNINKKKFKGVFKSNLFKVNEFVKGTRVV